MRLSASEPTDANPSGEACIHGHERQQHLIAHAKQFGNVDFRQNAAHRKAFLAKSTGKPRPARMQRR